MPRKRYRTEQIVTKLRQAEVELGRGLLTPQVCKKLGISEQTYYRWRKEYGGLGLDQAKRLKALEQENLRLKKLVADQALDNAILTVPQNQPKRGRLWLADGSCIRRRPEYHHHVWAYDFVADRTHDGRPLKILTVVDEYSRECLAIVAARRMRSTDVLETLAALFMTYGVPAHIRSDNGSEFTAALVRR